jgi:hypothetical protein
MIIMQLKREDIPLVTQGGGKAFVAEINNALDEAELHGSVLYVRYGPGFLQRLEVSEQSLNSELGDELRKMLMDEDMWDHQAPSEL